MYTLVLYIDHIHRYRRWKVAFTSATPRKLEHTVQSGPTSMNLDVLYVQITWQWHAISNYTYPFMSMSNSTPRFSDWAWPCPWPRHVSRIFHDHVHVHATSHGFFVAMSMSTPRSSKNFVSMPRPWPWRGHEHRCPFSSWPCPPNSGVQGSLVDEGLGKIHFQK